MIDSFTNTRLIDTSIPDLYSDEICELEAWFLKWKDKIPTKAILEVRQILVDLDDKFLM